MLCVHNIGGLRPGNKACLIPPSIGYTQKLGHEIFRQFKYISFSWYCFTGSFAYNKTCSMSISDLSPVSLSSSQY